MATTLYLLDTNILVHYVRADAVWDHIRAEYNLFVVEPTPLISVVTVGELRSLAAQRQWGSAKLDQSAFALGYFGRVPIVTDDLIDAYVVIDSAMAARGHYMGKNDLWIAATAAVTGATLLTTDADFDPLPPDFLTRIRVPVQLPATPTSEVPPP
jgi:tRNA(fMet)-specific endonuclease VapC